MYKKLNFAAGVLASGIANDAVEITLKEGHTITTDTGETNKFIGVFFDKEKSSPFHDTTREIVEAYRTNTNVFTIARAKEGTDAKAWVEDDNFMLIASSAIFDEYEDAINTKAPKASPEFTGDVTLENSKWLKSKDYSGAGYINILKGTIDDEVDIGAQLNVGTIEADSDAGAVALFDMPVSDASDDGAEMSVAIRIDANDILKVYAEADGAGGADSFAVKLLSGAGLDITEIAATSDTDKFLVSDSNRVKYRTGAEVLSDIGGQASLGFTPENVANKKTTITDSDTDYPTGKAVKTAVDAKAPLASPTFTGTVTLPKAVNIKDTSADHEYQLGVSELAANRTVTLPLLTGNDTFMFKDFHKASSSEINTGTEDNKYTTPDGLAGSNIGTRMIQVKVCDDATALTTGDGKIIFMIPEEMNGMNLVKAHAMVSTVSSSGTPTIQIRNVTDSVDMLSTRITIDASEYTSYTAATAPVIDTSKDDVATGDRIAIDVDSAGSDAKGLTIFLAFRLP